MSQVRFLLPPPVFLLFYNDLGIRAVSRAVRGACLFIMTGEVQIKAKFCHFCSKVSGRECPSHNSKNPHLNIADSISVFSTIFPYACYHFSQPRT